jgi:hypothetical protein
LSRVYRNIKGEDFNLDESKSIVTNYLDNLKFLDKGKLVIYSTRCMIRRVGSSLDNESIYKMAGKSIMHSPNINKEQFSLQLLYNISKLLITYQNYENMDIILFSKEWLSDDEYEKIQNIKKKGRKDIANVVDRKFVENSQNLLKDVRERMKGVKDVTAVQYIKKINSTVQEFNIDLNKKDFEGYIQIENTGIEQIKGIKSNCEILAEFELGIDLKGNGLIHTEYLLKDGILLQKITFANNGIVIKGELKGKRYEKLSLNYFYELSSKDLNYNKEINVIKQFVLIDYLEENGETLRYAMNDFSC